MDKQLNFRWRQIIKTFVRYALLVSHFCSYLSMVNKSCSSCSVFKNLLVSLNNSSVYYNQLRHVSMRGNMSKLRSFVRGEDEALHVYYGANTR